LAGAGALAQQKLSNAKDTIHGLVAQFIGKKRDISRLLESRESKALSIINQDAAIEMQNL